jgi:hypothetical protein
MVSQVGQDQVAVVAVGDVLGGGQDLGGVVLGPASMPSDGVAY